jgi:hypothetical protein
MASMKKSGANLLLSRTKQNPRPSACPSLVWFSLKSFYEAMAAVLRVGGLYVNLVEI